jgi:hypothetical protein
VPLVSKPGELVVCKCEKHAHMVINGMDSPEFAFKRDGYDVLYRAVRLFNVSLTESGLLREQIQSCRLPDEHLTVDGHLLWAIEKWNKLVIKRYPVKPRINFHQLLRRVKKRELPTGFFDQLDDYLEVGVHPQNPKAMKLN